MKFILMSMLLISFSTQANELSQNTYFGSIDFGVGSQKDVSTEDSKKGSYVGTKGYISHNTDKFKLDGGLGWFNYKVKTVLATGKYSAVSLKTQAPYIHISPKLKVTENILLGIEANYVLDDGVMLAPNTYSKVMLGVNVGYSFQVSKQIQMRIVASVSRTMDMSDRDLTLGKLSLDIGYTPETSEPTKLAPNQTMMANGIIHTKRTYTKVVLDETLIHFETNSYDLTMKSKALLTELAAFLASNPEIWQALEIEGHTDLRGGEEYNTILSVKRANSVYATMNEVSMPKDRVIFLGKGKSTPVDTGLSDDSFAKNRRVELKFVDVTEKEKLLSFIDALKKKYNP